MTCRDFVAFLSDYLEGDLDPRTRLRFDQHLAVCPDCLQYLNHYRSATLASAAAVADDELCAIPEDLVQAILRARRAAAGAGG